MKDIANNGDFLDEQTTKQLLKIKLALESQSLK
jgi:cell division FtsZ-interacting protein ZapD